MVALFFVLAKTLFCKKNGEISLPAIKPITTLTIVHANRSSSSI